MLILQALTANLLLAQIWITGSQLVDLTTVAPLVIARREIAFMRGNPTLDGQFRVAVEAVVVQLNGDFGNPHDIGPRHIPTALGIGHRLEQSAMDHRRIITAILAVDYHISSHAVSLVAFMLTALFCRLKIGDDLDSARVHHQHEVAGVDGPDRAVCIMTHRSGFDDDHRRVGTGCESH